MHISARLTGRLARSAGQHRNGKVDWLPLRPRLLQVAIGTVALRGTLLKPMASDCLHMTPASLGEGHGWKQRPGRI